MACDAALWCDSGDRPALPGHLANADAPFPPLLCQIACLFAETPYKPRIFRRSWLGTERTAVSHSEYFDSKRREIR